MRIERINENSISCTLTSFDLSVRNMNIRELAYGTEKARKLFEEMMSKASDEVGFDAEGTPIMVEAIPMGSDSIKLIISKVPDPEELDARFSRFTKDPSGRHGADNNWLSRLASVLLEGAENLAGELGTDENGGNGKTPAAAAGTKGTVKKTGGAGPQKDASGSGMRPVYDEGDYRAFYFDDLNCVISACGAGGYYDGESTLYKSPRGDGYVLVIKTGRDKDEAFARCCNAVAEYGRMIRTVKNSLCYYEEHYTVIVEGQAIQKLAKV